MPFHPVLFTIKKGRVNELVLRVRRRTQTGQCRYYYIKLDFSTCVTKLQLEEIPRLNLQKTSNKVVIP